MRFQPDTLWQALLRFFDMVAPDANIYVEIPAPDLRFAAIVLLAAALLFSWRKTAPGRAPTLAMLALLFVSAALWLATTGNGRYFMAMLVCAGPVAVALIAQLPLSRAFRGALALLLLAGQAFVLTQQSPWNAWTVMHWTHGSYFDVRLGPQELQAPPTTYASLSLLTYSLIAPQFPADSRWINLDAMGGTVRDAQWTQDFLRDAAARGPIKLIAPSIPTASLPNGLPKPEMVAMLDKVVARRDLKISGSCHFIVSPGLLAMSEREKKAQPGQIPLGFWTCPVTRVPHAAEDDVVRTPPADVLAAFRSIGAACPRFFPPEEATAPTRLKDGWMVHYGAQTHLFVMDDQDIWYQFWRNFTAVRVGTIPDVLAGKAQVDCAAVRNDGAWRTGAQ